MGHRIRTRPGRLALLDHALLALEGPLLRRTDGPWARAPVVDLGIGAVPWTTVELAERVAPLRVVGVDHSAALVEQAQALSTPTLSFVHGSFALPVAGVRLVRVMNVLRDGPPGAVRDAHALLGRSLLDGGLLVEGTCALDGAVGTAHWLRKGAVGLTREGLLLWLDGRRGLHPMAFSERLPRDLQGAAGAPVRAMLRSWSEAVDRLLPTPDRLGRAAEAVGGLRPVPVPGGAAFLWAEGAV